MHTLSRRFFIVFAVVLVLLGAAVAVHADLISEAPTQANTFQYYRFFATSTVQSNFATSTIGTATSTNITRWTNSDGRIDNGYFVIAGAKKATVFLGRSATTSSPTNNGVSTFSIQVTSKPTPSETDWRAFSGLYVSTTTSATPTGVGTATIAAATSTYAYNLDLSYSSIYAIRCIAVIATDGQNTCEAAATF